ncbi:hypothetical protein QTP86_026645 [Hemibagrus guttatus]|nr:hypothetical protein QTP86_026645 [Hemibagrus guttatus]
MTKTWNSGESSRSGRPTKITPRGQRQLIQKVTKDPTTTSKELQASLASVKVASLFGTKGPNIKFWLFGSGETLNSHKDFIAHLKKQVPLQEVRTVDECDFILGFCPIVSRAGTDIEAAMKKLHNIPDTKPVVLVVLHHTFDVECVVPDSSRSVNRENMIVVDCLFNEDTGLLQCHKNKESLSKTLQYLEKLHINLKGQGAELGNSAKSNEAIDEGIKDTDMKPEKMVPSNEAQESKNTPHERNQQLNQEEILKKIVKRLETQKILVNEHEQDLKDLQACFNKQLQEMMIVVEQQKTELAEKNKELEEKERLLTERETQLMERDKQLQEKDRLLTENTQILQLKDKALEEKEKQLREKKEELRKTNTTLENNQTQLKDKESVVKELETSKNQLGQELQDKQRQLQEMMIVVEQQKTELSEKNKELEEKESLLTERETQLMERDKQLQEKDRLLTENTQTLQMKDKTLEEKEQLREIENDLGIKQTRVNEKVRQQESGLMEKDKEIQKNDKPLGESAQKTQRKDETLEQKGTRFKQVKDKVEKTEVKRELDTVE